MWLISVNMWCHVLTTGVMCGKTTLQILQHQIISQTILILFFFKTKSTIIRLLLVNLLSNMKVHCTTVLLYDLNCASWPVLPVPRGDADHRNILLNHFLIHVSVAMWLILTTPHPQISFFFLFLLVDHKLYCQLTNNRLESFNSHQSVSDIRYTSVPSFPSAWPQPHCWELAWLSFSTDGNFLCSPR